MADKALNIIIFMGLVEGPDYYSKRFIEYLTEREIPYYVADAKKPETYMSEELDVIASKPNTVMFTFNNVGLMLNMSNGENFWKKNRIPVFDNILDHPRLFFDSMLDPKCDLHVFTLDMNHKSFIERFYPKVTSVYFSPNGGTEINSQKSFCERDIDVLCMCDCNERYLKIDEKDFADGGEAFFSSVIKYLIENTDTSTEQAIERFFKESQIDISYDSLYQLNIKYAGNIESIVRRHFKLEGIKALDEAGVHVDVYGVGWEDEDYHFSDNIILHDRIKVEAIMDLIGNSKISLCYVPWFKKGCSEKNFDSMLNGALCVSDRSEYLMNHYTDGYNIVYFDLNNPKQMATDIRWLLNNQNEAERIAKQGYITAKKYDTWKNRFDNIIETFYQVLSEN